MFTKLFYIFLYLSESVIANIYFFNNYKNKYSDFYSYLFGGLIYFAGYCLNILFENNVVINLLVFFFINIIFSMLLYYIEFKNAVIHSSILLAIMFATEMIVEAIMVMYSNLSFNEYRHNNTFLVIFGSLSKIMYLVVCVIISYLFSYKNSPSISVKKIAPMFLFPIMTTVFLAVFMYASILYDFSNTLTLVFIIISILSLVLSCFLFWFYKNIQNKEHELLNLQNEKEKNKINLTFYNLLEKKNNDQRILIHDIKHHFSAINSMDNINDIKDYLSKVHSQLNEYQFIGQTQNKMLDLILGKYAHICTKNGIQFIVDLRVSNLSFIDDNDLVSLFSNLLDNATEAAAECSNSFIRFTTKNEKSFIIMSIINSSSHNPIANSNKLITTKQDAAIHGYGIKSVKRTAEKYNGICQWHYDDTDATFHFNILFNKNK